MKIEFLNNWGDKNYIGLNQINFYDLCGNDILIKNAPKILQLPHCGFRKDEQNNSNQLLFDSDNRDPENLILTNNFKTSNLLSSLMRSGENFNKNNFSNAKYWITEFRDISKSNQNQYKNKDIKSPHFRSEADQESFGGIPGSTNNINMNESFSNFNNQNPSLNSNPDGNSPVNNSSFLHPASLTNSELNRLYFIFDKPISLGFIELRNLQENPERGAKEIQISLDENIIYKGVLKKFSLVNQKSTILFSSDNKITKMIDLKTINKTNLKNGYVYKQVNKTPEPILINNKDFINKNMGSFESRNGSTFSPTFNSSNNLASNNTIGIGDNDLAQVNIPLLIFLTLLFCL